jgi:putative N6-adenine-specific DNA methylase
MTPPRWTSYIVTHPGCEEILARELGLLGIPVVARDHGGAVVEMDSNQLYRANLSLRTASRVVVRLGRFHARTFPELERHARKLSWEGFVADAGVVHFRVTAKKSRLNHERAIVERLERSLLERIPSATFLERRADVELDERDPTVPVDVQRFIVRVLRDECTISADSSGPLLHRRGYRVDGAKAPLRETLAAALLLAGEWDGTTPLVDPLCGSGTIPIEAALLARRVPPGWNRRFAFERWPVFDPAEYASVRAELALEIRERASAVIIGSDRDRGAIDASIANAERALVAGDIDWRHHALSAIVPPAGLGSVITNPPYGARLGEVGRLRDLYAQLGHVLRRKFAGWRVTLLSADPRLESQVQLRWSPLLVTENGGIKVRIVSATVES